MITLTRLLVILLLSFVIVACGSAQRTQNAAADDCPRTEPVWAKPPVDAAIPDAPAYGYYFVNEDRSIWASAGWTGEDSVQLRVREEGIKVGWFRPAGIPLEITGQRLDAEASSLQSEIPCCTRLDFKRQGFTFPPQAAGN